MPIKEPSKQQLLQNEIEERMHELVCNFLDEDFITADLALSYMRAAYASGYSDCFKEPENTRGVWFRKLGYKI